MLTVIYAQCHIFYLYTECHYADSAECHYADCRYAECRGAMTTQQASRNRLGTWAAGCLGS
jgi:hypothetical protein